MAKASVLEAREETPRERKLDEWFEKQALAAPEALEAAARTIVGLIAALLGVLFGVLAVKEGTLPSYFWIPAVRPLGVAAVGALLVALICGLVVLLPRRTAVSSARPDQQFEAFQALLARKSRWLTAAVVAFGLGLVSLGAVLIVALLRVV